MDKNENSREEELNTNQSGVIEFNIDECIHRMDSFEELLKKQSSEVENIISTISMKKSGGTKLDLSDILKSHEEYESKLISIESELKEKIKDFLKEKTALIEQKKKINERETEIETSAIDAGDAGIAELEKRHRHMLEKIKNLDTEISAARIEKFELLEKEIGNERKKRTEELNGEITEHRNLLYEKLKAQFEGQFESRETEIEKKKKELEAKLTECEDAKKNIDIIKKESKIKENQIKMDREIFENEKSSFYEKAEELAKLRIADLNSRLEIWEKQCGEIREQRDSLQTRVNSFEDNLKRTGGKSYEELMKELKEKSKLVIKLEEDIEKRPSETLKERFETLRKEKDELESKYYKKCEELGNLKSKESHWFMNVRQLEDYKNQKEILEKTIKAMEARLEVMDAQIEKHKADVIKYKELFDPPKNEEAFEKMIKSERFNAQQIKMMSHKPEQIDETAWLEEIYNKCEKSGIVFNKRLLYAFHTALKSSEISPLIILAGVSGTGKSELPKLYSRFGGILFEPLSVQPNWDSKESLIGYYNPIENRFNATTNLLSALIQSQKPPEEGGISDRLLMVLLDEMNLAHVELYFSDFLSKLELRRGENKIHQTIDINFGAGRTLGVKLLKNVLWTGTMNQDETTKSLSDKVLDRGNIITFPSPNKLRTRKEFTLLEPSDKLPLEAWQNWLKSKIDFPETQIGKYKGILEKMNVYLGEVGRALGHRVWQSVEHYMANHPLLIKKYSDEAERDKYMKLAFEDQLVQKVMPKLRGIEASQTNLSSCLDPIQRLLEEHEFSIIEDYQIAKNAGYGSFIWSSAKYLEEEHEATQ